MVGFGALALACPSPGPTPRERADGHYLAGTAAYLQGDFKTALAEFDEVTKDAPDDPRLPAAVGEVLMLQGKLSEALSRFDAALARQPNRGTSWSRKGIIHAQLGQVAEAKVALRRALELTPNDSDALEQLGELSHREGDAARAAELYERAAVLASTARGQSELYIRAAAELQPSNPAAAAVILGRGADAGADTAELLLQRGDLLVQSGDFNGARSSYRIAAQRSKGDPIPWEMVGRVSERQGDLEGAALAYESSLAVAPTASVHAALGRVRLARGDRDGGTAALEAALAAFSGQEVREAMELADLLEQAGSRAPALNLLKHVAAEPGAESDVALQRRTAQLAKAMNDKGEVVAACARVRRAADGGTPSACP